MNRFGIRTVFLIVFIAAVALTSYRAGLDHGRSLGPLVPTSISTTDIYERQYDVSDLAKTENDLQRIVESSYQAVDPGHWDRDGGYAEVWCDAKSSSIHLSDTWPGHVEYVRFLELVREYAQYGGGLSAALEQATDDH